MPGEIILNAEVEKAREHYENNNVKFLLYVTMYDKDGYVKEKESTEEYKRLSLSGYDLLRCIATQLNSLMRAKLSKLS